MRYLFPVFHFLVLLIFSGISSKAQQLLNLDFEKQGFEGYERPWGWTYNIGNGATITLDSVNKHQGRFSLCITGGKDKEPSDATFSIEPYSFTGQKITLTGWIKASAKDGEVMCVTTFSFSSADSLVIKSDTTRVILIPGRWQKISFNRQLPRGLTNAVDLKLISSVRQQVWFDDFSLYRGGKKIMQGEVAASFNKPQMKWIEDNTMPFISVDAPISIEGVSDLDFLKEKCKDASIIALGESTHGTSEFFRLKKRVLEYAVNKLGVRVFAIEDNQVIVERVNNYVQGGAGTARNSMYGMFGVWQNEEVHGLIQWIRDHNDRYPDDKVTFAGFDMQNVSLPYDSLLSLLNRKDKSLKDTVTACLKDLMKDPRTHYTASDTARYAWELAAIKTFGELSSHKKQWLSVATNTKDSFEVERIIQYAILVKQYVHSLYSRNNLYRDSAMAENIGWIRTVYRPNARVLVWAHDYHISRGGDPVTNNNVYYGISMGSHLSRKYGNGYKAFSLSTFGGAYLAQISYWNFKLIDCPLFPGPRGTLDEALHRIKAIKRSDMLFLDLSKAKSQAWLMKPLPMRFGNHVSAEYSYWTRYSIPYQFDGIFFIDATTSAKSYAR